jgi:drug/metabolite transporter (DMT)-like permease
VRSRGVHVILILVQALMASLAITGRIVLPVLPPGFLVLVRVGGAAVVLWAGHRLSGAQYVTLREDLLQFLLLGLLGVTANQTLFLYGLRYTTAVNATILVTTIPIFTVLESVLTGRESASALKFGGIAVAAVGAIYLIGPDRISLAPDLALGNALILVGMICYSLYLVLSKRMLQRYRPITVSLYVMTFGALGVLPVGLHGAASLELATVSPKIWWLTAYIVIFPTILAYFLNIWALKRVSPNMVAVYIYLQPLFAALATQLFLPGEQLTLRAGIAGLTIFAGLALVMAGERQQHREVPLESLPGE